MDANPLCTALTCIRTLRLNVEELFKTLRDGIRDDHGEESKEAKFVQEIQDMLNAVFTNQRDLEMTVNSLVVPSSPMPLHNSTYLTQEISIDRQSLYTPLVLSHKWTDRLRKYSSLSYSILSRNQLKKSNNPSSSKRRRPLLSSQGMPAQEVDAFFTSIDASMDRLYQDMTISVYRPFPSNAVLQITIGRIAQALVSFKGIMIEWVVVKGYDESCNPSTDLMTESRYNVFKRVSQHAHAATLHFASPTQPDLAARSFITWLNSYLTLFTAVCTKCGKRSFNAYPPTWRDFRQLDPYHFECKPW